MSMKVNKAVFIVLFFESIERYGQFIAFEIINLEIISLAFLVTNEGNIRA